jgi:hypothetical protein
MYLEIFPTFEFLGWYTTGETQESDMETHKSLLAMTDNPLYLNLRSDPSAYADIENMPVSLMETVVTVAQGLTSYTFKQTPYHVETTESERIAVDQVAKAAPGDTLEFT